ncbi:hypothetical protein LCGC14_0899150 [marine sediment metagenome]|uniref:UDP-N-acetylglucosamine 2-epimerase domain-containing protein n=1 Tax=marine sediment metagenome TaxID=412755 RepID=A0A0F9PHP0_9ZZZZ
MNAKNVCVISGSRADYNYLKLICEKINKSDKLKLLLIITGMHLLKEYGNTIDLIKNDNIPITKKIPMYEEGDSLSMSLGNVVGETICKFTESFNELKPDIIIILGDRYEPLIAALTATILKIPIAHIHGGDISGTIDETLRHVITKLSHIHFPATPTSAERIRLMGEEEWRIHMFGSTSVDIAKSETLLSKQEVCKKLELDGYKKLILCLQHSNVFESDKAGDQMKITLQVLKDLNLQTVIIYPNNDAGSKLIIKEIENNRMNPNFKIFKNLERRVYFSLLNSVDLLIGNSSGGLIESPMFKLPVVNIGTRNKDRERTENVIDALHDYIDIKNKINKGLSEEFREKCQYLKNPYGDGTASDKIVKFLEELLINEQLLVKKLTYKV